MTFFKTNHSEAGGTFETIKEGEYEVIVSKVEPTKSSTGNPMIKVQLTIREDVAQDHQKRILFDNIVFAEKTAWRVNQILKALRIDDGAEFASIEEFASGIAYKVARVSVKHEDYQGRTQERVQFWTEAENPLVKPGTNEDPFSDNGGGQPIDISNDDLPF